MKFRTKIWMLPLGAALVFAVGVAASYAVGSRTLEALHGLGRVDQPALQQLRLAEQGVEQFRLLLQTAAVEGDADKLKEVQAAAQRTRRSLEELGAIEGKAAIARELLAAHEGYQSAAVAAALAMLGKSGETDAVPRMQATQSAFDAALKRHLVQAVATTDSLQAQAVRGVETALWVTLGIGLAVLAVLAIASGFVIRSVWRDLGDEPRTLHLLTRRIAEGDLQIEDRMAARDDRSLNAAIASMAVRLRQTVATIRDASDSIASASSDIAAGNANLSVRTEQSASNLQQTAASIAQLSVSVRQSAQVAQEASGLATSASEAARRGGAIMTEVVANMDEIRAASHRMSDIIGVIDGIAFQTNILALNAAVEAARAGEQGRGFAVVASEVRALAQRSAAAAREIKALIATSTQKVEGGANRVQDAGHAMDEIVAGVQRVTAMIGQISDATREQSITIGEVHAAANQLDTMTQQNSTLVDEAAAAADSMRELAGQLRTVVAAFRVDGEAQLPALPRPA